MKCLFFCQDVISKKNTGVGWALLSDVESTQKAVEYMRNGEVGREGEGKGGEGGIIWTKCIGMGRDLMRENRSNDKLCCMTVILVTLLHVRSNPMFIMR